MMVLYFANPIPDKSLFTANIEISERSSLTLEAAEDEIISINIS